MVISIQLPDGPVQVDLAQGIPVHIPLLFARPEEATLAPGEQETQAVQPSTYGVPAAAARPYRDGEWVGDTRAGGSCNFEALNLVPHCNGTHTECIGHLTLARVSVETVLTQPLWLGQLVDIVPVSPAETPETSDPIPAVDDRLITAQALRHALDAVADTALQAVVIRTLPNPAAKRTQVYDLNAPPPYLTREAAAYLVERGVQHLLVDVPSLDRLLDAGRLTAHRVWFGLPAIEHADSRNLLAATRPHVTVTELLFVPNSVAPGPVLVQIQLPAFVSDAAPSRVFLHPLASAAAPVRP